MRSSSLAFIALLSGCTASHPSPVDANIDAPLPMPLAEGVKRCASDADCNAAWPVCRCDARCWGAPGAGAEEHGPSPRTVTYAIGGLRIVEDASSTGAFGLDLDARAGGAASACPAAPDFTSPIGGDPAVDNQLQAFLRYGERASPHMNYGEPAGSIGGSTLDVIIGGPFSWFVEVSDIDSFEDDCLVNIRLGVLSGPIALGTVCTSHTDEASCHADSRNACLWSPSTRACRGIASGQTARIASVSGIGTGRIGGGVLRTGPIGQTQIELAADEGGAVATQIYDTRIEARLDAAALTAGQLGGWIAMDDLYTFASFLTIGGGPTFTFESLESQVRPDLPDETGRCTRTSAGFAFDALAVNIVP